MKTAGGIISLIASIFGIIMALITLVIGGIGSVFKAEGFDIILGFGWAGIFLSFVIVVFASVSIFAKTKFPSVAVIVLSIIAFVLGGTLVGLFMILAFIGGIVSLLGISYEKKDQLNQSK